MITRVGTIIETAVQTIKSYQPAPKPEGYDELVSIALTEITQKFKERIDRPYNKNVTAKITERGRVIYESTLQQLMANWVVRYRAGMTRRGLCLCGDSGVGKTIALQIIGEMVDIQIFNCPAIVERWCVHEDALKEIGQAELIDMAPQQGIWREKGIAIPVGIDDIGREREIRNYGARTNPVGDLICYRDQQFQSRNVTTLLSTNYKNVKKEGGLGCYGSHVVSRIYGMCTMVLVESEDNRQTVDWAATGNSK